MNAGLGFRVGVVLAVVLASIWLLVPTFLGKEVQDRLEAAAAREADPENAAAPATPDPWYVAWLPNKKVALGLDLQGGLDLTVDVDVDEAVRSSVQRDVDPLKQVAQRESVALADVKRDKKAPVLRVQAGPGVALAQVRDVVATFSRSYAYARTETVDGVEWHLFEMTAEAQSAIATGAVQQALETIRNRIDETGVKEPSITLKGDRGISIQLPGETDEKRALAAVGTTAQLEFILVEPRVDTMAVQAGVTAAQAALPPEEFQKDAVLSEWLSENAYLPANRRLLWQYVKQDGKDVRGAPYVVEQSAVLTGDDVNDAQTNYDPQRGEWYVMLEFKPRGQQVFAQVTGDHVGEQFAIVLDGRVRSAPQIRERINGNASITMGGGNIQEQADDASMLALVLRSGSLPAPVTTGEIRKIGASLGEQAINEGMLAAGVGSALVLLFAAFYYRVSGVLADITLVLNALLVVALLAMVGATLTLPGICGIALTIGMAVDCNIIIFERIREELRAGRSARKAIDAGFDSAFVAVLDSNVTTLLAGVVMYSYGSGPLKGFAVTLMIGIFTTLFTGVFVSRALMDLVNRRADARISI